MAGEAAHVQFIDDRIFERRQRRTIFVPIIGPANKKTAARCLAVGDGGASGVEENDLGIEAMAASFGPVDAPAIAKDRRQAGHENMPVVAGAMAVRIERYFRQHLIFVHGQNNQPHRRPMAAQQGKVHAVNQRGGPQGQGASVRSFQCFMKFLTSP